ncbi:hypothetical protein BGZ65_001554 [Modicella reniformis]|uniref:Protein kinase domain-containing protein n=1 Tax=Modicella reniformis TaxID=1440133 RepID=A0A9P6MA13_9FUNG|nr:hypothetical protein BGZ65_001554 [Modicella reniformis]
MWRVRSSPNIVQLLEAWEQKGKIYMRMELCKLGSLKSAMQAQKKYGGFDEKRAWKCFTDLALGLRAIHDNNIIHLDIKPENVFITAAGSLKIGDFGISITCPVEDKDVVEGDKHYMALELLNGQVGKYSDIFSLGISMYEMVTNQVGELPGEGRLWHRLREEDVDMDEYMIGGSSQAPSSTICSSSGPSEVDQATVQFAGSTTSSSVSEPIDTQLQDLVSSTGLNAYSQCKLFSKDLLGIIKEMLQPAFEQRPTAASILKCSAIQQILTRRNEQGSKGMRSEEAMSGLLLQSI